ncbi:MAG: 1-(5-phosphoribosyl)-5-[(5-phosphoribosylamino)methylideneamino]imidazole-4-carboxamide isomerase, partial [Calditrichaeota bacterium]|nr:1-(5-phosphoribosyl)-5-[(5-phosphoribosylamino)methylideneamino]imidazole-4-carboxamide isomerase [Calditrichota bacterium]
FGGGIQSTEDLRLVLESGADMVTAGSVAVKKPELVLEWFEQFGADRIILGADVRGEKVAIHGWQEDTRFDINSLIRQYQKHGLKQVICTDIDRDGMLQGPNFELYRNLSAQFPEIHFIASGGVSAIEDLFKLQTTGVSGVIIGKAFYEGTIDIKQLDEFLC